MKVLIATNLLQNISPEVYVSHCAFWTHTIKNHIKDTFHLFAPTRMQIDKMRNYAAKIAIEGNYDYLMFIDDDILLLPETFTELLNSNLDVCMALTYVRGAPFDPMLYRLDNDKLVPVRDWEDEEGKGIILGDAVGTPCTLINTKVFSLIEPPYFVSGTNNTEDIYFCIKLKTASPSVTIGMNTRVPTDHLVDRLYVSRYNLDKVAGLFESTNPVTYKIRGKETREEVLRVEIFGS